LSSSFFHTPRVFSLNQTFTPFNVFISSSDKLGLFIQIFSNSLLKSFISCKKSLLVGLIFAIHLELVLSLEFILFIFLLRDFYNHIFIKVNVFGIFKTKNNFLLDKLFLKYLYGA
jgi:ABC-type sugar transport system permease subunit